MKRCPECHRVETDDALTFCRTDGTPLVRESGSVNPDAGTAKFGPAPSDDSGYQFWLNKLNSFGGDYRKAELVRAFLAAAEYS